MESKPTTDPPDDRPRADTNEPRTGEERFRVLFETMAVGMALSDPDGRIQRTNLALQHFLGRSDQAVVESNLLDLVADDDRDKATPVLSGPPPGSPEPNGEATELRFQHADGGVVWGSVAVSWLHDGDQNHTRVVSVLDITRRKQVEEALISRQKLDAVGRLAGGIAHDFNNILTVIQGNLSLAEDDAGLNAETRALLAGSARSVRRAQDLAQQLITFAEGGSPLKRKLGLADLVREVGTFTLHGTSARLELDAEHDLLPCLGDPGQLAQAFHHVFLNAVEAMPSGGSIRTRIRNEVVEDGAHPTLPVGVYLRVEVEDAGVGIPEQKLEHVFDPYFSTKRAGGGLGLPIVLSVLRRHGGHAELRSRVGQGTVVTLHIPAAPPASDAPPQALPATMPLARRRVLVMDDDADLLDLERRILSRLELDVTSTVNGESAVDAYSRALAEGHPYALVLLDLTVVGGMGGLEALGRIRAIDPKARAVVCSGYCRDPVMADHYSHGFDGMVPKPFTPTQLRDEIRRVLSAPVDRS